MDFQRVGILSDEVSARFDEALDWIAGNGLRHTEVRVVDGVNIATLADDQVRRVRDRVESRGLFVSGISSPVFKCALDPSRPVASGDRFGQQEESVAAHFDKLARVIEIAKLLGTRRIRIFSFWREIEPANHRAEIIAQLRRAADIAAKHDVLLLLENEPSCNGGFAAEVSDLVRGVNSPSLRALWDPGNEVYGGREAFPAGYEHVKDVLAHVHLKDAYHRKDGSARCVPMGSGDLALLAQLRALKADGYDGLFTIETHFIPAGCPQKTGSQLSLDALRTIWKEI
ncbi:sugar phosphate isomerase/epimerase family protein [Humisphaera borealis]|uniref:Sugar phosphate isomerase/epimerase n=1 Tax=Humisphaera borealis TaxID=2807512 RepID=A0A7M2X059_9BACT|nr:sugar phosphate isomerase/epimerase family protein [Humisphaera borealis]QOV91034.1 sugar phosphate isomerase/epimerase [Humisphaera borealis]